VTVGAVVLAAGRASRMGRPKVVLPWRGRPLLAHVLGALAAAGVAPVVVVTGPDTPALGDLGAAAAVFHPDARLGMGGSIAAGISSLAGYADAAFICLGDQPGIAPQTIAALVAALRPPHLAARPIYRGGVHGHPVLFSAALFGELAELRGDHGARGVLLRAETAAVPIALDAPPDVDTPEDYARLSEDVPGGNGRAEKPVAGTAAPTRPGRRPRPRNGGASMKIARLELFTVPPRWLFLKVTTDAGISGWGEPVVEGKADTVRACVEEMADLLVGQDPHRIEDTWQMLYRGGFYRGGPVLTSALSGIDQALWDIKGRALGVPVWQLLGGACRDRIRVYSGIGGDRPADVAAHALRAVRENGFTAVKMNATGALGYIDSPAEVRLAAARLAAVREAVGEEVAIAVDFHGRVHRAMALQLAKAFEPFSPMFIEEPVLAENNEVLALLATHTTIPIATGERMFTRWGFKRLLQDGHVAVVQPDLSHAGGITECRKIGAMAEAYDVALAPHCPLGPLTLAASLQVDACTPNFLIQEQSLGIHYNQGNDILDYLADRSVFAYHGGYVPLPQGPGLGIEIDEDAVRRAATVGHRWRNPIWRLADGSIAEW